MEDTGKVIARLEEERDRLRDECKKASRSVKEVGKRVQREYEIERMREVQRVEQVEEEVERVRKEFGE
jgi:hypothetical protein